MSAIGIILSQFIFQSAFAATFDVPVNDGDRLILKGLEAQVQFVGQAGKTIKVSGVEELSSEGAYTLVKKDNVIEIKMNEFSGKRAWLAALPKAAAQTKKIEIIGAPVPVEVHLRGGSVVAQKWTKDVKVSLTQGRASVVNGAGTAQIYVQKGDVNVQDHTGKVEVDSYSGTMSLRNIQGDVDASLFTGQLQIEKMHGFLNLTTQQSNSKVSQSSGTVQFENGKGNLNIQAFQGRMEGQSVDGNVTIAMDLDSEVDVKSKTGRVSVQLPPSSGASLNLLTTEGDILVPAELKVAKLPAEKSVRGRLRGDAQRGSVFVRSQEGVISVK